jgi:hypothetical protein
VRGSWHLVKPPILHISPLGNPGIQVASNSLSPGFTAQGMVKNTSGSLWSMSSAPCASQPWISTITVLVFVVVIIILSPSVLNESLSPGAQGQCKYLDVSLLFLLLAYAGGQETLTVPYLLSWGTEEGWRDGMPLWASVSPPQKYKIKGGHLKSQELSHWAHRQPYWFGLWFFQNGGAHSSSPLRPLPSPPSQ